MNKAVILLFLLFSFNVNAKLPIFLTKRLIEIGLGLEFINLYCNFKGCIYEKKNNKANVCFKTEALFEDDLDVDELDKICFLQTGDVVLINKRGGIHASN